MQVDLAESINKLLTSQLRLIVRRDKHEEPCVRLWSLLLHQQEIFWLQDYLIEAASKRWKRENIWLEEKYFRCFSVDYFAFADPIDVLADVEVSEANPEENIPAGETKNGKTLRLFNFIRKTFRREKPKPAEIPVRGRKDYYQMNPKKCPDIVLCNTSRARFGDDFPLSEDSEKRQEILTVLRDLEMAATMCLQAYQLSVKKLTCILCFRRPRHVSVNVIRQLIEWMKEPRGECYKLFPVLNKVALNDRFLFIAATAKMDAANSEGIDPIETANPVVTLDVANPVVEAVSA